ncbi:MAG: TMEM43 family protein [Planctomycetia bacterium]|nr:TMEM43 family protein [Planctomycetia bacterium]
MAYTETVRESYFSRIGDAFKGVLVGIILIVAGIVLLFWNEGRTVKRYKALKEANTAVISVDSTVVDPANEGKLIHLTGPAKTNEILTDADFNVATNAIRLQRNVEMYQWQENSDSETKKKLGGGTETVTTYTYTKTWFPALIDSSLFKESGHENPKNMPYQSLELQAKEVTLGAFRLSDSQIQAAGPEQAFRVGEQDAAGMPAEVDSDRPEPAAETSDENAIKPVAWFTEADRPTVTVDAFTVGEDAKTISLNPTATTAPAATTASESLTGTAKQRTLSDGGFYLGADPARPEIGDMRVTYSIVPATCELSLVSQQRGDSFVPYKTKNGSVELLEYGHVTAEEMFTTAQSENTMLAWILRLVGFVVLCIGFNTLLKPFAVLADVVPFIGSIVGTGTGIFSFLISLAISLGTISIAWLYYRPLLGIPLAVAAVFFLFLAFRRKSPKRQGAH